MGTVGLNFGSPTSGAGFNVSTTVNEIVSNLQNVETPWKNQLTQLQSQDTAISNLGTLLSTLSNDVSSLTSFTGILAQKTGSSSDTNVLTLTSANSTAVAGTHTVTVSNLATTASGYLAQIANANDTLTGSITLRVGSGTAQTITLNSSDNTLAGLAAAINASGVGVVASVLTDANGSRLSLVSGTSGANGNITISDNTLTANAANTLSAAVTAGSSSTTSSAALSAVTSTSETLTGTLSVAVGSNSAHTINMSDVNSAESGTTLADLEAYINSNSTTLGFTATIVTNSDGTSSLKLTSGTSGSAGTLTVSSALVDSATSLEYTGAVTGSNANLTVDGVALSSASNTVANLIPGVTFQLLSPSPTQSSGGLEPVQVMIGKDNTDVESTVKQMVSDYNALISAINTQEGNDSSGNPEPLFGTPTLSLLQQQLLNGLNILNPNGSLDPLTNDLNPSLSGSITIQVGSGTAQTITLNSSQTSLSSLVQAINSADIGVTAGVATSNGQSTLILTSQTEGSAGALTVNSSIVDTGYTPLSYTGTAGSSTQTSQGALTSIPSASDALTGSITIQVGNGTAVTVNVPTTAGDNTLAGLEQAINNTSGIGVTATIVTNSNGSSSLALVSNTSGSAGTMTVTSNVLDTTNLSSSTLNYTNSSDIHSLTTLGISVNNDGSITFDASTLDSLLNSDYGSVVGFFQNANSWGQSFSNMLTNAGASSSTGMLSLSQKSNSNIESTLNAEITKENAYISAQQASLTKELNTANQILQELPTQLEGVNEIYSAISGYNENTNG